MPGSSWQVIALNHECRCRCQGLPAFMQRLFLDINPLAVGPRRWTRNNLKSMEAAPVLLDLVVVRVHCQWHRPPRRRGCIT